MPGVPGVPDIFGVLAARAARADFGVFWPDLGACMARLPRISVYLRERNSIAQPEEDCLLFLHATGRGLLGATCADDSAAAAAAATPSSLQVFAARDAMSESLFS